MRYGAVFVLRCEDHVLLTRRPDKGLLGGMMGFPGTAWDDKVETPLVDAPLERNWEKLGTQVRHVFTHFDLRLVVYRAEVSARSGVAGEWAALACINEYALPTVMTKVLTLALDD